MLSSCSDEWLREKIDWSSTRREFSQTQRGAFGDNRYIGDQRYPRPSTYPSSTKKILAIVLPIVGVLVLGGIGALVFLYYRRFRKEQYRTGKAAGAIRLQDSYSGQSLSSPHGEDIEDQSFRLVLPQDLPMEKPLFQHQQAISQAWPDLLTSSDVTFPPSQSENQVFSL